MHHLHAISANMFIQPALLKQQVHLFQYGPQQTDQPEAVDI